MSAINTKPIAARSAPVGSTTAERERALGLAPLPLPKSLGDVHCTQIGNYKAEMNRRRSLMADYNGVLHNEKDSTLAKANAKAIVKLIADLDAALLKPKAEAAPLSSAARAAPQAKQCGLKTPARVSIHKSWMKVDEKTSERVTFVNATDCRKQTVSLRFFKDESVSELIKALSASADQSTDAASAIPTTSY